MNLNTYVTITSSGYEATKLWSYRYSTIVLIYFIYLYLLPYTTVYRARYYLLIIIINIIIIIFFLFYKKKHKNKNISWYT